MGGWGGGETGGRAERAQVKICHSLKQNKLAFMLERSCLIFFFFFLLLFAFLAGSDHL